MLRLALYLVLFVASLTTLLNGLSRQSRQRALIRLLCCVIGGSAVAALLGVLLGWLIEIDHAAIWCGIGFGLAGSMVGLTGWLFQHGQSISSHDVTVHGQAMTRLTLVALSIGSILGALVGTWAGIVLELDEGLFWSPTGALLGTLLGAYAGLITRPRLGWGLLAFTAVGSGGGLLVAYLADTAEHSESVTELNSRVAPASLLDQMYDREKLLDQLFANDPDASFAALTTLWMLSDGGPKFYRVDTSTDSTSLRESLVLQQPWQGTWIANVEHLGQKRRLELEFFCPRRDSINW